MQCRTPIHCVFQGFDCNMTKVTEYQCRKLPWIRSFCHNYNLVLSSLIAYRCLSFCLFSFIHCVVCHSSICRFWLPYWYRQNCRLFTLTLTKTRIDFLLYDIWMEQWHPIVLNLLVEAFNDAVSAIKYWYVKPANTFNIFQSSCETSDSFHMWNLLHSFHMWNLWHSFHMWNLWYSFHLFEGRQYLVKVEYTFSSNTTY